ncbi:MAG TPA: MFS transporter [Tepidisphaeraceae bacterium]|jgi:ACS family hexuronate transporter-like MFS transporter|nr:MFS transporter [Tepidisphaeraceae bacterium]
MSLTEGPPETTIDVAGTHGSLRPTRFRWVICTLLFFATTVNYVDRSVLSVLAPTLQQKIHWTDTQYGNINAAFTAAYAVGLLLAGRMIDIIGVRFGYAIALICWAISSMCHALVRTAFGFGVVRVCLGFFESANFPAAVKSVAEWFPNKERSFAIGLFNSGSNVGAIVAPLVVPIIAIKFGWQWAFVATGCAELIWVFFWIPIYRRPAEHPRVSKGELAYITSDPYESVVPVKWAKLLVHRQTWAFSVAKFLTDPIWWFWLFWASPFFHDKYHVDLKHIGLPLIIIYNMASVGSIGGGWIPTGFARLGWSNNASRKVALLICALCVLPVMVTPKLNDEWLAILLIGVAAAAHQGFSANLFALSGDLFPRRAVASVVGLGGMFGAIGGMLFQAAAGRVVDRLHSYLPLFVIAGSAYVVAVLFIHLLTPRLEMATFDDAQPGASVVK